MWTPLDTLTLFNSNNLTEVFDVGFVDKIEIMQNQINMY